MRMKQGFSGLQILLYTLALSLGILTAQWNTKPGICANSVSCLGDLSGKPTVQKSGVFMGQQISIPSYVSARLNDIQVLGEKTGGNKHIYVDLSKQHLYAVEDGLLVMDFPISSGKWYPTPTGDFKIWIKLRATRMTGGNPSIGTYYDLPNVPYTMFFYNDEVAAGRGFSLHGAYWHNNFGHPMSHGCVNISIPDAERLYNWADPPTTGYSTEATKDNPGTVVTIFGTTPDE